MLVSLPFVLLLMDYWPLERFKCFESDRADNPQSSRPLNPDYHRSLTLLVLEKAPFFVLVAVSSAVTFLVQRAGGAVKSLDVFPLHVRLANAIVSYVIYVWKFIWPSNLAVFYPHPGMRPIWQVAVCVVLLLAVSVLVIRQRYGRPYLATGWLWYLGTLVPVIGVVQVGAQSMADRYTYVPLIGLFIIIAWGVAHLVERWSHRRFVLVMCAGTVLSAFVICTQVQVRHWRNSITVFKHATCVNANNYLAHCQLGIALAEQGRVEEAIAHYSEALRIKPDYPDAHNNVGVALAEQGRVEEAIAHYSEALRIKPDYSDAYNNLGLSLAGQGRIEDAMAHYRMALQLRPDNARARNNLGIALAGQDKLQDAITHFREAIRTRPGFADFHYNLGTALSLEGKFEDAIAHYRMALQIRPDDSEVCNSLGVALVRKGQITEAIAHFQKALHTKPDFAEARNNLRIALARHTRSK
jgi:Flp pilus assembly protein TadD